ncbi:MAG: hypothetical protein GX605_06095 [Chloroflexi bacterium]|nr:hypothetical protein [Chloroflexota bacterium]
MTTLTFFYLLTGLAAAIFVGGLVWTVIVTGQMAKGSQRGQPRPFLAHAADEEAYGFAMAKRLAREGRWGQALPIFVAVGGFLGLLLWGSVVAWLRLDDAVFGLIGVSVAVYVLFHAVRTIGRA